MAETEVSRHFRELKTIIQRDGFDSTSRVMRMVDRLYVSLREDGFFPEDTTPIPESRCVEEEILLLGDPEPDIPKEGELSEEPAVEIRAFRVESEADATLCERLFSLIPAWRTQCFPHLGSIFVLVYTGQEQDLSPDQIRGAIVSYVGEAKEIRRNA